MDADSNSIDGALLKEIHIFARTMVRSGGEIAMSHFGHANPDVKYDESLVTEADLEVQEYMRRETSKKFPDHRFLGEENPGGGEAKDSSFIWVVDPVDGTSAFSRGYPVWGISAALLHKGRVVAGAFYMPITGELFSSTYKGPPVCNDTPIEVRYDETIDNESLMLTYSRFHRDFTTTFPGKVRSMGSTVAHICYVAKGAAWGAVLNRVHIWDIVAGQVILEAAGGEITDFDGNPFEPEKHLSDTRVDKVLLAAAEGQHRDIKKFLKTTQ